MPGPQPPTQVTVLSSSITLTAAEVRALPSLSISIVDAPGAGKTVVPFYAWFMVDWVADFGNVDSAARIGVCYGNSLSSVLTQFKETVANQVSNLLVDGASHAGYLGPEPAVKDIGGGILDVSGIGQFKDEPGVVNTNLKVFAVNDLGNFTLGTGTTVKVTVLYTVIDA